MMNTEYQDECKLILSYVNEHCYGQCECITECIASIERDVENDPEVAWSIRECAYQHERGACHE